MRRFIDYIFLIYFTSHIGITIFFDSQVFLPPWVFPAVLRDILNKYCVSMKDPLLMQAPAWYEAFLLCEFLLHFPFFFVSSYAYWKGARRCPWIRLPVIIYGTHTSTTLLPILYHILMYDFESTEAKKLLYAGPVNSTERFRLAAVYFPYLIIPLIMVADGLFSKVYTVDNNMLSTKTKSATKNE